VKLRRHLFEREFDETFAQRLELFVGPSTMVEPAFEAILNDKAPARLLRLPRVALQTCNELF
jgi:hypothetical protein